MSQINIWCGDVIAYLENSALSPSWIREIISNRICKMLIQKAQLYIQLLSLINIGSIHHHIQNEKNTLSKEIDYLKTYAVELQDKNQNMKKDMEIQIQKLGYMIIQMKKDFYNSFKDLFSSCVILPSQDNDTELNKIESEQEEKHHCLHTTTNDVQERNWANENFDSPAKLKLKDVNILALSHKIHSSGSKCNKIRPSYEVGNIEFLDKLNELNQSRQNKLIFDNYYVEIV